MTSSPNPPARHLLWLIFAAGLCAYGYFYQAGGWNQNSRFDLVRSIVERERMDIDPYHGNTGDKACRGPEGRCTQPGPGRTMYCDKAPGASFLALPFYASFDVVAQKADTSQRKNWGAYLATLGAVCVPSAVALVALFLMLCVLGLNESAAAFLSLSYGLGTLAFPYATLFYGHQLTTAFLLIGWAPLLIAHRSGRLSAIEPWELLAAGVSLGFAIIVEYPSFVPALVIGIYALWLSRSWKVGAWLSIGALVPGFLCAWYQFHCFGGPLSLPYEFSTQPHRSQGAFMGLGAVEPKVLWELSVGSYRGLFRYTPWLSLAVPGAFFLWVRARSETLVCVFITLFVFWLNASLIDWQGGWAMGPRYLVPALPFMTILVSGLARPLAELRTVSRRALLVAFLLLVAYSSWNMLKGCAVKPEVPSYIDEPYEEYIDLYFGRGELSISTQGIDMASGPDRGEPKAWNWGHKMGLGGLASLLPLALVELLLGVLILRQLRTGCEGERNRQ